MLLGISRTRKSHTPGKTVGAVEPGGAVRDIEGRAREQAAADQNDEADAELQAKQHAPAKPFARIARDCGATFMQRLILQS